MSPLGGIKQTCAPQPQVCLPHAGLVTLGCNEELLVRVQESAAAPSLSSQHAQVLKALSCFRSLSSPALTCTSLCWEPLAVSSKLSSTPSLMLPGPSPGDPLREQIHAEWSRPHRWMYPHSRKFVSGAFRRYTQRAECHVWGQSSEGGTPV